MPGGGGPPPLVFTTIDVAEAGTSSEQGTIALAVNLTGDVAGYYYDTNGFIHGFIRNAAGAITTVDVPGNGNHDSRIFGIDAAGNTVGAYFDSLDDEHSFVRSADGNFTTFDPPNSNPGSGAQSINENGTVADVIFSHYTRRLATGRTLEAAAVPRDCLFSRYGV